MRRRSLPVLLPLLFVARPADAQRSAASLIGTWLARVNDPLRGSALVQLTLGNDGSYQRLYGPEAYPGGRREAGVWQWRPGVLHLRWDRYEVAPTPARQPPQQGTSTLAIEFLGRNAFRFRDPSCRMDACWGTMRRLD